MARRFQTKHWGSNVEGCRLAVACNLQDNLLPLLLVKSKGSVYRDRKFPFRTNWKIMYFGEWSRNGTRKLTNLDLVIKKANELCGVGDEEAE